MDPRLNDRLEKVADEIDSLKELEGIYLQLKAQKDALYSALFIKEREADKSASVGLIEARVYASQDWSDFIGGLVEAEVNVNHARRYHELKLKAFDGEYLTLKTETPVIRRQGA